MGAQVVFEVFCGADRKVVVGLALEGGYEFGFELSFGLVGAFLVGGDGDFAGDGVLFGEQDGGDAVGWVVLDGHSCSFLAGSEACGCVARTVSPRLACGVGCAGATVLEGVRRLLAGVP